MKTIETDVLVVGGGPTGLTAGILLARLGLSARVVERREGPQRAPAAHCVNARSFEIWRQAGVDMDALLALAKIPRDAGHVYFTTKLGGEVLGTLPYERQGDDVLAVTPTPLRNLSQHRLEPLLARELARIAAGGPHYSERWESSAQDEGGVTSTIREVATGGVYEVRSRYVIAADGAGSPIRKSLGIDCIGPDRLQAFLMIHFEAGLREFVGDNGGVLYWVTDPECAGTFVAHDVDREWVFMHSWDPDSDRMEDYPAERCETLVRRAMSGYDGPVRVRAAAPWVMTSQVAERYRDGRIFLTGDAAHRFPPTGGLGLNTGVQDVHNLAWKIAATMSGSASPPLLDSYEAERLAVARNNAEQSLANAMKLMELFIALGTNDEPSSARASFDAVLADPERRAEVVRAIENQAEHFDMLGLQLGYRYAAASGLDDGPRAEPAVNPVREFVPTAEPGARLPHGWIVRAGRRLSTLDLVTPGSWSLFVRPGSRWHAASKDLGVPLTVVEWGRDVEDPDDWWSRTALLTADGALLVRPDQHVAARFAGAGENASARLASAVRGSIDPIATRACA